MTVYADILFLINFSMDFLSLRLTAKIMHIPLRPARAVLSSSVGAMAGTLTILFIPDTPAYHLLSILAGVISSVLMGAIAMGWNNIIRKSAVLWGAGAFIGGIFTLLLELGGSMNPAGNSYDSLTSGSKRSGSDGVGEIFIVCAVVSCALVRLFSSASSKKTAELRFTVRGKSYAMTALCDSGSSAADPFTAAPVVIVASRAVPGFAGTMAGLAGNPAEPTDESKQSESVRKPLKVRVIPIKTAAGERVLYGFVPDSLSVDGKERDAVIAVDGDNKAYSGFPAIVPAKIT